MPAPVPKQLVHEEIAAQIQKSVNLEAKVWQKSKEPVTASGRSLSNLYHLARRKVVNGKSFFGHGDWYAYLEKHHGVMPINYPELRKWTRVKPAAQHGISLMGPQAFWDYCKQLAAKGAKPAGWRISDEAKMVLEAAKTHLQETGKIDNKQIAEQHGIELGRVYTAVNNLRRLGYLPGGKSGNAVEWKILGKRSKPPATVADLLKLHRQGGISENAALVLVLRDMHGLSQPETSKALGLSRNYVDTLEKDAQTAFGNGLLEPRKPADGRRKPEIAQFGLDQMTPNELVSFLESFSGNGEKTHEKEEATGHRLADAEKRVLATARKQLNELGYCDYKEIERLHGIPRNKIGVIINKLRKLDFLGPPAKDYSRRMQTKKTLRRADTSHPLYAEHEEEALAMAEKRWQWNKHVERGVFENEARQLLLRSVELYDPSVGEFRNYALNKVSLGLKKLGGLEQIRHLNLEELDREIEADPVHHVERLADSMINQVHTLYKQGKLSERQTMALLLKNYVGLTTTRTAKVLGISVNYAGKIEKQARRICRENLQ